MKMRFTYRWLDSSLEELDILWAYVTNVENQLQKGLITFVKDFQEYEVEAGDYIHEGGIYDGLDDSSSLAQKLSKKL